MNWGRYLLYWSLGHIFLVIEFDLSQSVLHSSGLIESKRLLS